MAVAAVETSVEDHALEAVPLSDRKGWLALTWNTAGIVTSLIQLFFGALVTFVAGFKIALTAGVLVTVCGALLGWACGHIAYRTGLSSTVMSRYFGFGKKGSILSSLIFGFMIIGFLALENALLYKGLLFYFKLGDTMTTKVLIYGALSVLWIVLTAWGFNLVARVSSVTLVLFLLLLAYITWTVVSHSGATDLFSFKSLLPAAALDGMGVHTDLDKFFFCVNVLIGSAGALALVDADMGRYARRSADIGIAALIGNLAMDIVMLSIGGIIMYAGVPVLIQFYTTIGGFPHDVAARMVLESPDSVAAAFVIFGGLLGTLLMLAAQGKAQVLNTYSASLALSNLFDAVSWRPGRLLFVIAANVIGLIMLYGQLLQLVNAWITMLGVVTTALASVMVADYYIVRRGVIPALADNVNWAGVLTTIIAVGLAHYVLDKLIPVQFFSTLVICLVLYPVFRLTVFKAPVLHTA